MAKILHIRRNFPHHRSFQIPLGRVLILLAIAGILGVIGAGGLWKKQNSQTAALRIETLSPQSGAVGTEVEVQGSGFAKTANTVLFAPKDGMAGYIADLKSSDGENLKFMVPEGLNLCPPNAAELGIPCPEAYPPVTAGDYIVTVQNSAGESNAAAFTVTGE